jgi:hypothetical protein
VTSDEKVKAEAVAGTEAMGEAVLRDGEEVAESSLERDPGLDGVDSTVKVPAGEPEGDIRLLADAISDKDEEKVLYAEREKRVACAVTEAVTANVDESLRRLEPLRKGDCEPEADCTTEPEGAEKEAVALVATDTDSTLTLCRAEGDAICEGREESEGALLVVEASESVKGKLADVVTESDTLNGENEPLEENVVVLVAVGEFGSVY